MSQKRGVPPGTKYVPGERPPSSRPKQPQNWKESDEYDPYMDEDIAPKRVAAAEAAAPYHIAKVTENFEAIESARARRDKNWRR